MKKYIKLMRPYQWVKNLFCLAGVVFGLHFAESNLLFSALLTFIVFCLAASSIYVLNDIIDVVADRAHPKKKERPIAAGKISISQAYCFFTLLLCGALGLAAFVSQYLVLIVLIYIIMNMYYSKKGKHIVIFDVFIISIGFLLRVFAGTFCIGISISQWLVLCVMMLTLFLGFSKRRSELLAIEGIPHKERGLQRRVLEKYEPKMLDMFISITAGASILSYALFIVINHFNSNIIYTVIFVIYGIFRYIFLLYAHGGGQDTANELLDDKHLIITIGLWIASYVGILLLS